MQLALYGMHNKKKKKKRETTSISLCHISDTNEALEDTNVPLEDLNDAAKLHTITYVCTTRRKPFASLELRSHLILRKNVSNSLGRHMNTWLYNLYNNFAELVVKFWMDHQWQYVMPWRCTLIGVSRKHKLVESIGVSSESWARHGTSLSTVSFPTSCPRGCYLIEHTYNSHN